MRLARKFGVVLFGLASVAQAPRAQIIRTTIKASISNLTVTGRAMPPPLVPATMEFSTTFDNSTGLESRTVGLTPMRSPLPFDSGFGSTCGSAWTSWPWVTAACRLVRGTDDIDKCPVPDADYGYPSTQS